jgi:hypothetical protein
VQITTVGNNYVITIGWVLAILILLIAILGLIGVVPFSAPVVFGMLAGLAIARLI